MPHPASLSAVAVALLAAAPAVQAGMYPKNSPVMQVVAKDYDRLVAKSNYTTIMEFYAPWCGHCQNLKPAYEKAARNLDGLAHVAAMDCDDDANKPFCGSMGVKGFPTLKIVRPGKKYGKPVVEDYNGARTAAGIVEAVVQKINNHVAKVTDKDLDSFLEGDAPKALLFTEKGTTSALLKSIAIDFLGIISVGQVRSKETAAVAQFGVEDFPALVLIPGGGEEPVVYEGEMKKPGMVEFLSKAGSPNADPPAAPAKKQKKKDDGKKQDAGKDNEECAKDSKDSKGGKCPMGKSKASASEETKASTEDAEATETVKAPVIVETAIPIPTMHTADKLAKECLTEKSSTCVLAFVPEGDSDKAKMALDNLAELAHKHAQSKRHLFPFFAVPASNPAVADLLKLLDLTGEVELIALNARRGWWRHYDGSDFSHERVESWIDAIRMSEGVKKKLPEGIVAIAIEDSSSAPAPEATSEATPDSTDATTSEAAVPVTPEASGEPSADETTSATSSDPTVEPEAAPERKHEEL